VWLVGGAALALFLLCGGGVAVVGVVLLANGGAATSSASAGSAGDRPSGPRKLILGTWQGFLPSGRTGTFSFYSDGIMEDSTAPFDSRRMKYVFVDDGTIELSPADIDPEVQRAIGPPPRLRLRVKFPSSDRMVLTMNTVDYTLERAK